MDIQKKLKEWQKDLRLLDWDIRLEIIHPSSMPDATGRINVVMPRKSANIQLANPEIPQSPDVFTDSDPEATIVHELIHIHIDPFMPEDSDSLEYEMAEMAIDQLARAFVALKRGK